MNLAIAFDQIVDTLNGSMSDFLKFVFRNFLLDTSEFLLDLHFLCKIVLKPSNVIPLLLF